MDAYFTGDDMAEIDESTTFELLDDVMSEEIDDELVILDLEGDVYFSLNDVGRVIWEEAASGATFGEVVEAVCEQYEVDRERAESDAADFLSDVLDEGLMEKAES